MASLLTAIGAGLVVGQGRRIEAAEEAQSKADAIRAQKLMEFDFAKQLQESKLQGDIKLKQMEMSGKQKEIDPAQLAAQAAAMGWDEETTKSYIAAAMATGDQKQAFFNVFSKSTSAKKAEETGALKAQQETETADNIKLPEIIKEADETVFKGVVSPTLSSKVSLPNSPEGIEKKQKYTKAMTTLLSGTKKTGPNNEPTSQSALTAADSKAIVQTLLYAEEGLTKGNWNRDKKQFEPLTPEQTQELIKKVDDIASSYPISPETYKQTLKDLGILETIQKVHESSKAAVGGSSAGGGAPAPLNQSGGGEVQGTVMPNEVKPQSSNYKSPADVKAALDAKQIDPNTARSILQTQFGFK